MSKGISQRCIVEVDVRVILAHGNTLTHDCFIGCILQCRESEFASRNWQNGGEAISRNKNIRSLFHFFAPYNPAETNE